MVQAIAVLATLVLTLAIVACSEDGLDTGGGEGTSSSSSSSAEEAETSGADDPRLVEGVDYDRDFEASAADFVNINDMTKVRGFYVDNRLGDLDEAVAVAESPTGGVYPPGTIVQLVPNEAMVKRQAGYSPEFADWEFFVLSPSPEGTAIVARGGPEVMNRFGGSCATCHAKAEVEFDFVCEKDHGCDPLPIGDDVFAVLQQNDPRPRAGAGDTSVTSEPGS
jgi:hypothetical protein